MAAPPTREFGQRKPAAAQPPEPQPAMRSSHVALLLMGTVAIGAGAYALMPSERCRPASAADALPAPGEAGAQCPSGRSSSAGGRGWGVGFWPQRDRPGIDPAARAAAASADAASPVTRGGFGAFARDVAAHFSRGG